MKDKEKQFKEMAKYKRLTNKNIDEYNPEYDFCVDCKYFGEPNGCNRLNGTCDNYERFIETYGRLEELEDKIENGTLIELPCKYRDMVWFVYEPENDKIFLDEGVIQSFSVDSCGLWFYVIYKSGLTYWHKIESIGERVFLTKAEAEKKLEELKSGVK